MLPDRLRRATVAFDTREAPGTIIIDTGNTALYYVLGQGRAIRYGVGVGRDGFTWSGVQTISRKAEWPDWYPPAEMVARQPYLPRFMAGGPGNPLGARAMYLGSSQYRIHGTNDPSTIGKFVSSGCIRLTNEDVTDLFSRVNVGTKVVVLPKSAPHLEARGTITVRPTRRAVASGRDHVALGPSGDESFDIVAVLSASVVAEAKMNRTSGKQVALGAAAALGVLALVPAAQAEDFFSALFGAFGGGRPHAAIRLPFGGEGNSFAPQSDPRPRVGYYSGGSGLLRAYLRRALFSGHRPPTAKAAQRRATASARRAKPKSSTAAIIDNAATENGKPYSELPNAFRYRNETGRRDAPATARTRSASRRSESKTIRRFAEGDIVAGADGLMVAGRGADKRGASLNFSPGLRTRSARGTSVCRWWRGITAADAVAKQLSFPDLSGEFGCLSAR